MRFIAITLIHNVADPITGVLKSPHERFRDVVDNAVLFEELGFDGYGVGERHHVPFISTAPPVILSHIAARTSRIRLFSAVTLLSILDPVRVAEDYATLDHLSDGRLEVIIGKGNGPEQAELFGLEREQQWTAMRENYELLHSIWHDDRVTWNGSRRPALHGVQVWPKPLQMPVRVWHGSATSEASVDLAARFGDPLFSANVTNPVEPYAALVRHYRERWVHYGHDPAAIVVGAGSAGYYAARRSQDALDTYRPIYAANRRRFQQMGLEPVFTTLEDYVARSSALVGSPQQIIDKVHRYHGELGHSVLHVPADGDGLTDAQHRATLELLQSDIAPTLRRDIEDPPWPEPIGARSPVAV